MKLLKDLLWDFHYKSKFENIKKKLDLHKEFIERNSPWIQDVDYLNVILRFPRLSKDYEKYLRIKQNFPAETYYK